MEGYPIHGGCNPFNPLSYQHQHHAAISIAINALTHRTAPQIIESLCLIFTDYHQGMRPGW